MLKFATRSIYSFLSGICIVSANFFSGIIVAHLLGVHDYGVVAFMVWLAFVLAPVVDGGTAICVGRFTADLTGRADTAAANALPGLLMRRLVLYNLIGAIALVAFLILRTSIPFLAGISAHVSLSVVFWVAVLIFVQSLATFSAAYLRGCQNFKALARLTLVSMIVQIALLYEGVKLGGVVGAIAAYAVGQACIAAAAFSLLWRRGDISTIQKREISRFGRSAWAANICNTFVWSRMEILILQYFWGFHEVGFFSVALALSSLAAQGPLLLTGAFLPMFAEKHGRNDVAGLQSAFSTGTRLLALVAIPVCFGMAAIAPVLIRVLYGPDFAAAAPATAITVVAAAFSISTVIGTHLVNALGRSDFIFYSSVLGAVLSMILGLLFIPNLGLIGAAISRSIVQLAMIGLGLWFIVVRLGFRYDFTFMLRALLSAAASALAAAVAVNVIPTPLGLVAAILLAVPTYLLCLRLFGAVHADDIQMARQLSRPLPQPFGEMARGVLTFIHPGSLMNIPRGGRS